VGVVRNVTQVSLVMKQIEIVMLARECAKVQPVIVACCPHRVQHAARLYINIEDVKNVQA